MPKKSPEYALRSVPEETALGSGIDLRKKAIHDVVALSWATGVLCYRDGDPRPGTELPPGDYTLFHLGPNAEEPLWLIRKGDGGVVSWEGA